MNNEITIFKTGKIYEIDLISDALTKANIPYFKREETSGGLKLATPAMPVAGLGIWYSIIVPEVAVEKAKEIIKNLPIEAKTNPSIWDFSSSSIIKKGWKIYAIIIILIFFSIILINLIK